MSSPLTVCIVVPALNEAERIGGTLSSVRPQTGPWSVCVVDGGSSDRTVEAAREAMTEGRVLVSPAGRAAQMNAGAAASESVVLLFLHADTRLPPTALDEIRTALRDPQTVGGCFRTGFDLDERPEAFGWTGRAAMRLWEARFWMRWHRLAFGDRALFVRREAFLDAGGFPDQPILEDLDFVRRIRRSGRFVFLDSAVTTSARRFLANGAVRQQLRNLALWLAWNAGASPERLKSFYPDAASKRGT